MFAVKLARRALHRGPTLQKKAVPAVKAKNASSQQWLIRQLTDPFVERAKMLNYRCRSAFKLLEMDERFKLLADGKIVVDCGSAPGSWTQVAVKAVNSDGHTPDAPKGTVISVDKQQIYPIEGALILGNSDFTVPETQRKIKELLGGSKVDGVLSDMAPSATGLKEMDDENMMQLCYSALRFAVQISKPGAFFLVKLWQCHEADALKDSVDQFYSSGVKILKPNASRKESAEVYFLARNFKGLKM